MSKYYLVFQIRYLDPAGFVPFGTLSKWMWGSSFYGAYSQGIQQTLSIMFRIDLVFLTLFQLTFRLNLNLNFPQLWKIDNLLPLLWFLTKTDLDCFLLPLCQLLIWTNIFIVRYNYVVYFDQRLVVAHSKIEAKFGKKMIFFQFAPKRWLRVIFPEKTQNY